MNVSTRSRTELKTFFVQNAIPTQGNFADLIDAALNQRDDGIAKPAGSPLCIEGFGEPTGSKPAVNFYEKFTDAAPAWSIALNPHKDPAKAGFGITDGAGQPRLVIDKATGRVTISTTGGHSALSLNDNLFLDGEGSTVRIANNASISAGKWAIADPAARASAIELRDDGKLELLGTRTKGMTDFVRLATFDTAGLYAGFWGGLSVDAKAVGEAERTSHLEHGGALYRSGGQVYLTVDDLFYVRRKNVSGTPAFTFNTANGTMTASTFVGTVQVEEWKAAQLGSQWTTWGAGYNPVQYYKDPLGRVHVRGLLKAPDQTLANPQIIQLPSGYQPPHRMMFVGRIGRGDASGWDEPVRIDVLTDGKVLLIRPSFTYTTTYWVSVDGLSFRLT